MAPLNNTDSIVEGFGGMPQWGVTQALTLANPNVIGEPGFQLTPDERSNELQQRSDFYFGRMGASIETMNSANESMLKGEIPADVSAAVRRAASENSIMRGIGGQAGRALSARDLGVTSSAIQQQGMQNQEKIAGLQQTLATTTNSIREAGLARNKDLQALENDSRRLNLDAISQERQRVGTNIQANMQLLGLMRDMVNSQYSLAAQMSLGAGDPSGVISAYDAWLARFAEQFV